MNAAPSLTDAFRYPHFIAMAVGVAGSPIASLLVYGEREPYLSWVRLQAGPWLPASLFPRLTRLMSAGVFILVLSGVSIGYLRGGQALRLKILVAKWLLVAFVFLNAMHLGSCCGPGSPALRHKEAVGTLPDWVGVFLGATLVAFLVAQLSVEWQTLCQ